MKNKQKIKKLRRLKPPLLNVAYSMGKWLPHDDYLLIQSVLQLSCLKATHQCTRFSQKFTLKEIQERWYAILYDPPISKLIYSKLQSIPDEDIERLKEMAPYSDTENEILAKISCKKDPTVDEFEEILISNRDKFHESRNAYGLKQQWKYLRQYRLLEDQFSNNEIEKGVDDEKSMLFEEQEKILNDNEIMANVNVNSEIEEEMSTTYKRLLNQIKKLEAEVFLWQILANHVSNKTHHFEDIECLALIQSDNFEYVMKSREITFGRATDTTNVDLDFSLIGVSNKISRNQGVIKMADNCTFYLYNNSRRPIFVDGKIVLKSCKTQLFDKSIIQICDFSLLFFINFNIMAPIMCEERSIQK